MSSKFKKLYVNEKYNEDITNGVISYELITDIFFNKKNTKNSFRAFSCLNVYLVFTFITVVLCILSFSLSNLYIAIASIIYSVLLFLLDRINISISSRSKKNNDDKNNSGLINMLDWINIKVLKRKNYDNKNFGLSLYDITWFYTMVRTQVGAKQIYERDIEPIVKYLSKFVDTSNLVYINESDLDTEKENKWSNKKIPKKGGLCDDRNMLYARNFVAKWQAIQWIPFFFIFANISAILWIVL